MIENVFFDLDETLVYSSIDEPEQEHFTIVLADGVYYTIIRPEAKEVLRFARELVGKDKVFILTAAMRHYAMEINVLGKFDFTYQTIHAMEDLQNNYVRGAYGGGYVIPSKLANPNNVLIDNLPIHKNFEKLQYIGIKLGGGNYLQVDDYYGVNFPDCTFEKDVKAFLETKHE
jgi:hypothetical protein